MTAVELADAAGSTALAAERRGGAEAGVMFFGGRGAAKSCATRLETRVAYAWAQPRGSLLRNRQAASKTRAAYRSYRPGVVAVNHTELGQRRRDQSRTGSLIATGGGGVVDKNARLSTRTCGPVICAYPPTRWASPQSSPATLIDQGGRTNPSPPGAEATRPAARLRDRHASRKAFPYYDHVSKNRFSPTAPLLAIMANKDGTRVCDRRRDGTPLFLSYSAHTPPQ